MNVENDRSEDIDYIKSVLKLTRLQVSNLMSANAELEVLLALEREKTKVLLQKVEQPQK